MLQVRWNQKAWQFSSPCHINIHTHRRWQVVRVHCIHTYYGNKLLFSWNEFLARAREKRKRNANCQLSIQFVCTASEDGSFVSWIWSTSAGEWHIHPNVIRRAAPACGHTHKFSGGCNTWYNLMPEKRENSVLRPHKIWMRICVQAVCHGNWYCRVFCQRFQWSLFDFRRRSLWCVIDRMLIDFYIKTINFDEDGWKIYKLHCVDCVRVCVRVYERRHN